MIRMTEGTYRRLVADYAGICTACRYIADDARDAVSHTCNHCGANRVMGVEQALIFDLLEIVDEGLANVDDAGPTPRAKLLSHGESWKGRRS